MDVGLSVDIGTVGFEGMADSIQTVVGTEDSMQHLLDSVLCDQFFSSSNIL